MNSNVDKAMEMTMMLTRSPEPKLFEKFGFKVFMFILLVSVTAVGTYLLCKFIREKFENRIKSKLNGELGDRLRNYLPIDAIVYTVHSYAITWQEANGNSEVLQYSSLGFGKLPDKFEYVVCQWIRDNIVYDGRRYHFESMSYERDRYEESNTATIKRDIWGEYKITRDPGEYVTTKITIGHALVHDGYDFEGHRVNTQPLKKW